VPLLLGASDWSLERILPVPPLDQRVSDPPPVRLPLDGWTRLPPLASRLETLPACAAHGAGAASTGTRFLLTKGSLRAEVDGAPERAAQAIYDVRLDGSSACLAGVTATLSPDRHSAEPPAPPRAEGGERGLPLAAVRRMSCALGPAAKP
jgi:hypothetical protein